MTSKARCLFFLLLALSLSFQTHARDSKFFNRLTRSTKENKESVTVPNVQTPKLTPLTSQESEVVQHGYGLYGQDPYDKYEYPPTTTNPTKTPQFDEEFSNSKEFNNKNENAYVSERQGMSDTRFLENGKYFYDVSQEQKHGHAYGHGNHEKKGLSDTRFLENGKYFYDVNNEKEQNPHFNTNENKNFEAEKQGMSDTRFFENGKYFYDVNNEEKGENAHFNNENENENFESLENEKYYDGNNEKDNKFDVNNYENENENENENEKGKLGAEKQGMSDTRFLENGKYFYDVNNEKENNHNNYNYNSNNNYGDEDVGFHGKHNIEYAKNYNEYENNEHETQGRGGYNYSSHNEYHAKQGSGGYNYPNKFPKYEYDTMEEYDRAQGNIDGKDHYLP